MRPEHEWNAFSNRYPRVSASLRSVGRFRRKRRLLGIEEYGGKIITA
jgi:hypothetical protein